MKKLLLLFSLACVLGSAQPLQISIITVNPPGGICPCKDSVKISFRFTAPNPPTPNMNIPLFWLKSDPFQFQQILTGSYTLFYSMDKHIVGADTVYSFWWKPCDLPPWTMGDFIQLCSSQTSCFNVAMYDWDCQHVGIKEEYLDDKTIPVYYDMYGNKTEKKSNTVLIEYKGRSYRKVIFND